MRTLKYRMIRRYTALIFLLLAGLGFVLGQLFPVYMEYTVKEHSKFKVEEVVRLLAADGVQLSESQQAKLESALSIDPGGASFRETRTALWKYLSLCLAISFTLAFVALFRMTRSYAEPIDHLTSAARELARGNYLTRAIESGSEDTFQLSRSINVLARNLQEISIARQMEEERLKTLIENMGSALLMIGFDDKISEVNRAFLLQFQCEEEDIRYRNYRSVGFPEELLTFIDHVLQVEQPLRKQIEVEVRQKQLFKEVYGAPVIGDHGRWLGIIIVTHDITELVHLEQIRKDFVANVSHELNTPITSIIGFSETLLDGAKDDPVASKAFLEIIYNESKRMQMLIHDLLDLSKMERKGFSVDLQPVRLEEAVRRTLDMTAQRLEEKRMRCRLDADPDVIVSGDFNRLVQILMNLLTNAITYSPEDTAIEVAISKEGEYGCVAIIDEGIGMTQDEINRIFERFYRIDRARSRNSGGTGLGLAIVKHLVEAHEGRIEIESEVGSGSRFTICIPLDQTSWRNANA